ncbi:MAG: cation-efflux pump [Firmicutes bacterium]|nr:cation-efflux pump [Bacillota bacterium]
MTKLLIRLFVKDWTRTEDPSVRRRYGVLAGLVGILCNVLLFGSKLTIGILSRSVSITADAVNNLTDASSNVITLIGFYLARKEPDEKHPFGYARVEYLSGLGVAALILVIGAQLLTNSIEKILHPAPIVFSGALVAVLVLSILVKLWMAAMNRTVGRSISSTTLMAVAADSRNDVITTSAVLVSAVIAQITGLMLDGYIGLLVACFIIYSGIAIGKETISPLLGVSADPELVDTIREETLTFDSRILSIHDLVVHDYGPGQRFATLHVEMDAREDPMEAHEILDRLERRFREEHRIQMVIHHDPVLVDDEEMDALCDLIQKTLCELDQRLTFHDFRLINRHDRAELFFDVVTPYEMKGSEEEIREMLGRAVQQVDGSYHVAITFDYKRFDTI